MDTVEALLAEIAKALLPLKVALSSPANFYAFMLKLGWRADSIPQPLADLGTGLDTLFSELRKVVGAGIALDGSVSLSSGSASANISLDDVLRLQEAVKNIIDGLHAIASAPDALIPASLQADNFKASFPEQIVSHLLIEYLRTYHSSLAFAFQSLGIIKKTYSAPVGNRPAYVNYALDFSDIPTVFQNPGIVLQNAFGWGTDSFDPNALISQLDNLLTSIGVDVIVEELPGDIAGKLDGGEAVPGGPIRKAMRGVFFERARPSGRMAAEIKLLPLPKNGAQKPGIALLPSFNGLLDFKMELGPGIAATIKSDLDLQGGVALLIRPDSGIEMLLGFNNPGAPVHATGSGEVRVERSNPDQTPTIILGSKDSTRLQYQTIAGCGGIRLDASQAVDVFAELEAKGLEFIFQPSDGDGFIQKIFPAEGVTLGFDLAVGASHQRGFYFRGTSSLEIAIPIHVQLGPIAADAFTISVRPEAGKIPIGLGCTFKAALGPLNAVVENVGLTTAFSFPAGGGNLGPLNLDIGFKPPNGVGLSLDVGVVKGGGYLFIDADRGEYAGALELTFSGIVSLKALGIITTKQPDGSPGFSLLIIITAEFGTGIQLGFGFTLLGVGGLLGLNRTMNLQALADGVRTGSVNSIMFPQDVVANAPKIISDLRAVFPPHEGTFLIGPMAKLGWGTPTLVSLSLGVIIEIPGNIAIVGVLKISIPADEIALIVLQVAFVGAIEFDKDRLWFYAVLFESRIVFLSLEGEMGLLVAWGDDANFVVSVGGFHPRFSPPPLPFPSPRRISVSLASTPVYRIRVEAYFAVTSNTVQFGARAELFFGLDEINVQGYIAFDALFQFSPFYFIIEISAALSVNVFGAGLFSVSIRGSLAGPSPYHVLGHGSISLLFWDIGVDFDETWGETRNTELPSIPILPILAGELGKADNWRALLPPEVNLLVSLRKMSADESALILHPIGVLHISQRAVPLELKLDKVGTQKPSDVNRLSVAVTGGGMAKVGDAFEQFAPAQFQDFSDSDKLSKPAFGKELAGLNLAAAGEDTRSSVVIKRIVRYEEIIIDSNYKRFLRRFRSFNGVLFKFFLKAAGVTRCELSQAARTKLQPFEEKIAVINETFTVAFQANNQAYAAKEFHSEARARDYLNGQIAQDASLVDTIHVIPSYELAA